MVWSPTPWPRIFHFHGIYSILDAKPHISMVFAPVWMENLIFPWYVQHFECKTSYFHDTYILTYTHSYIHTYMHACIHTCIHAYIPLHTYHYIHTITYRPLHTYHYINNTYHYIHTITYIPLHDITLPYITLSTYLPTYLPTLRTYIHAYIQDHIHKGGGGNHDRGGGGGVPEPGTYIRMYVCIYIYT